VLPIDLTDDSKTASSASKLDEMSPPTQPAPTNVYLLPLTDGGAPDVPGGYINLPAPNDYVIRFVIEGTSSICREGTLWVNIPEKGKPFERKNYREFK
jgi:glycogen debranching enzyme